MLQFEHTSTNLAVYIYFRVEVKLSVKGSFLYLIYYYLFVIYLFFR